MNGTAHLPDGSRVLVLGRPGTVIACPDAETVAVRLDGEGARWDLWHVSQVSLDLASKVIRPGFTRPECTDCRGFGRHGDVDCDACSGHGTPQCRECRSEATVTDCDGPACADCAQHCDCGAIATVIVDSADLTEDGWQLTTATSCDECEYVYAGLVRKAKLQRAHDAYWAAEDAREAV